LQDPELRRYGYAPPLATGTLAAGGTLGILIPPSVILIVYAISTEQNIAKLFMAALIPGLVASALYVAAIAWVVRRDPAAGPAGPRVSGAERMKALLKVWPILLIAVVVVGGIYGGVFTPTEGAAVGAVATLVVAMAGGSLGWSGIKESLLQTAETSAMIFLVLLGAEVFNAFLALSQLPTEAAELITRMGLPPYVVLVALLLFYIVLGGVMDELAMLLLTLPVFFPIVMALDFGLDSEETAIWFGILVLIIVNAIARQVPITETYRGVLPFLVTDFVRLGLVLVFPGLALVLVRLLS
jgi:C4-dicarboxylate transporter DctM subunit